MFILNVISILGCIVLFISVNMIFKSLNLYKNKEKGQKLMSLIFVIFAIISIVRSSEYVIPLMMFGIILFSLFYSKNVVFSVISIATIIILFYMSGYIMPTFVLIVFKINLYDFPGYHIYNAIVVIPIYLFFLLEIFLLKKIIVKNKIEEYVERSKSDKDYKFIGILAVNIFFVTVIMYINATLSNIARLDSITLIYIFIVYILYVISSVLMSYFYGKKIQKDILMKKRNDELENLYVHSKQLQELSSTVKSYKEDTVNILNTAKLFLTNKDYKGLEVYIEKYIPTLGKSVDKFETLTDLFRNIKSQTLISLLIGKIQIAESKNINVTVEIKQKIGEFKIGQVDLNRIVGILLDNAIEATEQIKDEKKREIRIAIINSGNFKSIVIMNTVEGEIPPIYKMKEKGFSTKGEKRGIGLNNVSKLTSKYDNVALNIEIFKDNVIVGLDIREVL